MTKIEKPVRFRRTGFYFFLTLNTDAYPWTYYLIKSPGLIAIRRATRS